jgi:protein TonB
VKARPDTAHNPPPRYPEMARRNGWEGRVMVRAHVSAAGRVTAVSLHQGCAYGVLNQAALAAVRTWRFRPGTIGGQAADSVVEVPVNFSLRR